MSLAMPDEWWLYLRKSKGRAGISRQRTTTTGHLARTGGRVIAEFEDTDSTAYAKPGEPPPPRKDFVRLLAAMASRPGVGIAAWHADRLLRNPEDTEVLIRACLRGGHLIETARGGTYDVSQANGRKRLRDDANDAQHEVDHNRERVLEKKTEARGEGTWPGGPRPFGYQPDEDAPGGLALDPREAPLLAAAYADLIAGVALTAIARGWNNAGVAGTRGAHWDATAVRRVLRRATNAGLVAHGGRVEGPAKWPPVTGEAAWRAACAILASPARRVSPGPEPAWLLSGIALCGACGAAVNVSYGGSPNTARYRCQLANRHQPRRPGPHPSRDAAQVDAYAAVLATTRMKRRDARQLLREDHTADRSALLAEEARLSALWDEQGELYLAGSLTPQELTRGRTRIAADREGVRARLAGLDEADALAPMLASPDAAWDAMGLAQRRAVVRALMFLTVLPAPPRRQFGARPFDPAGIDVRWVRPLPSDG